MDRLIGTSFGPYRILEQIGEGGMGVVYRGYQESLNRYVAIKVLRGELARNQEFIARFGQEARAVARLSHPNILHVYDAGVVEGRQYMAMDYAEGGSVKDLLQRGPIQAERAVSLAAQVADALDQAHQHGLVHRDVKPGNILLARDGRPLLTDFGIARALDASTRLTRTGASIGTPEYMSPEQGLAEPTDGRTDIYALGIVLYEMLTGHVPFHTETPMATLYKQVHEPPPPLRRNDAELPSWLEKVVAKALSKRPADRFQTASEFAAALRQGKESRAALGLTPRPATPTPAIRRTRRNPVPLLVAMIGALLFLLIGVGLYLALSGSEGGRTRSRPPQFVTMVVTPQQAVTLVVTSAPIVMSASPPIETPTAPPIARATTSLAPAAADTAQPTMTLQATATRPAVTAPTATVAATEVPAPTQASTKAPAPTAKPKDTCPAWYEKPQPGKGILLVENHIGEGLEVEQIRGGSGQWSVAAKQGDIPGRLLLQLSPGDHQFVLYVPPRGRGSITLRMEAGQQFVSPIWYNDRSEDYVYPLEVPKGCN